MKFICPSLFAFAACCAATSAKEQEVLGVPPALQGPVGSQVSTPALLDLHRSLVEIPSPTRSEGNVSQFLKVYLRDKGFTVFAQRLEEGRENVLAYLGTSKETRVLVTSHIDTVPPFLPYDRRGDQVWGRGSVDAKGSVASQIIAVESLVASHDIKEGDVALLFVVGEEGDARGMADVNDLGLSWEAVIFGEPTELKLARGHKGGLGLTVTTNGKTGHSGYPELGKNAIDILVRVLGALQQAQFPWSDDFGNTTLNIGMIGGGVAPNVIPGSASASASVRIAAGTVESVRDIIEKVVYKVADDVDLEFSVGSAPIQIDHDVEGKFR